jgi:hypothetical protein
MRDRAAIGPRRLFDRHAGLECSVGEVRQDGISQAPHDGDPECPIVLTWLGRRRLRGCCLRCAGVGRACRGEQRSAARRPQKIASVHGRSRSFPLPTCQQQDVRRALNEIERRARVPHFISVTEPCRSSGRLLRACEKILHSASTTTKDTKDTKVKPYISLCPWFPLWFMKHQM